jgi:formylglycine-generating enzyme required for sulfatase activity
MLLGTAVAGGSSPASGQQRLEVREDPIVWLPEGWFLRGSDDRAVRHALLLCLPRIDWVFPPGCPDRLFADERPARRVWVSAFGIDRTEVTVGEWRRCVAAGQCAPLRVAADARTTREQLPATGMTWDEAASYCRYAGGRLPTEAEWERAARGPDGRHFPWGRAYNDRLANHGRPGGRPDVSDGYRYAAPVGSFPQAESPHGLLDMAGNVWEWTADRYDPEAYRRQESIIDPTGPESGTKRVVRGGSWRSPPHALRVTHREPRARAGAWADVGLRCAYDRRP